MKHIQYILFVCLFSACGQPNSNQNSDHEVSEPTSEIEAGSGEVDITQQDDVDKGMEEAVDYSRYTLSREFQDATVFDLTDTIRADFNGDGNVDEALFVRENEASGIVITHGVSGEEVRLGFGQPLAHLTDFNWVDFWGLVNDAETYEIVIEGSEILGDRGVVLENPSIAVRRDEEGGGLITYKDGSYVWIHQAG